MNGSAHVRELLDDDALRRILAAVDAEGAQTRVVGGAVRNALLGMPVKDIDCATTARPRDVMRLAQAAGLKAVPTGIEHGTVTVVADGRPFEITTLRRDVETDGRHAEVAFGTDFREDARRRDFTINALYLDRQGVIHDFTGGLADIAARRVRFIGDAGTRIREDYLRILRFFRFWADYGEGPLDAEGLSACIRARGGLFRLSRERVRSELLRILVARGAVAAVTVLCDTGFLPMMTGGVAETGRFARVCAGSGDGLLRLAALCVTIPEDAERLRERLRLSNGEHERLSRAGAAIAHLHGRREPLDARALRRLAVLRGLPAVADALAVTDGEPSPVVTDDARVLLARYADGSQPVPVFPLSGRHLAARGVPPGPRMGQALERARALWLDADCPMDGPALAAVLAGAVEGGSGLGRGRGESAPVEALR
ncbi:MAG: CCA tRNA nucleotidyltransferase [Pseudochelatococcus sp.]|jgi:poly(A) polymerase|uniref:CCA tRNA nucleotidyltransferase n=1 Tax=Pseudochelatococcus sp. TaxID=2020869 RepID=UPI003D94EAA7